MVMGKARWSIIVVAVLLSLGATIVEAGDCSVASIKGSFGFVEQGTGLQTTPRPYTNSGIATFDGTGLVSGKFTLNVGGVSAPGTFTGTYTVDPDCTFSIQFTTSLGGVFHQVGTLTGEGIFQEGHYIYTDTGLVATGTAKRISSGKGNDR